MNPKRLLVVLPIALVLLMSSLSLGLVMAEETPLFKMTIIAPGNANMVRRQWGQLIANSYRQLGIDARVVYLGWAPVYDRVLTPARENVGKTYDNGGFDAQLIGYTPGLIPEPRQGFSGEAGFLAPDGQNYYLWQNPANDLLLDTFITATDPAVQEKAAKDWQVLYMEEMPVSQIVYQSRPSFVSPKVTLDGDWWLYFNAQPGPEYLKGKDKVVYASTGEIQSLIPPLANSWYDTIITSNIFNGLASVAPDMSDFAVPSLLTSWTPSTDGFKWTFKVREGVTWHDGVEFNADDVLFSIWTLMNPSTGSQFVGYFSSVYGDNTTFTYSNGTAVVLGTGTKIGTITAVDKYTIEATLPVLALGKPYGYFDPYLLAFANNIIPKHIFENIAPAEWANTVFNTGQGETIVNGKTYTGPIGTGPYKWDSFDPVSQLVKLVKNDQYWDKANLEAKGVFGVKEYYIKFIADKTPAIASLKNGQADILDPNYEMNVDAKTVDPAWATVIQQDGAGRQELGYNMRHPVFGTGVDTPLGKQTPTRAAEAAKYVRQALDYAIPRELVIANLLDGAGLPGATAMLPTQAFYNTAVTARPYDLNAARELLTKAGYKVPGYTPVVTPPTPPAPPTEPGVVAVGGFIQGMSSVVSGVYELANHDLQLIVTKTKDTQLTTGTMIAKTTTDLSGFYTFTVTPTGPGTWHYYLFDAMAAAGNEWTYAGKIDVISLNDSMKPVTTALTNIQTQGQTTQTSVTALQASIQQLQTTNTQLSGKIDALTKQLTDSQTNTTNAFYIGVAGLFAALAVGIIVLMRQRNDD
jgi:ABC-type transport system substrate-binding protein